MRIAKSTQPEKKGLDPPKCVVLRYLPRVRVSLVGIGQRDSATIWRGRVDPRVARLIGVMVGLGVAHVSGTSTAQYPPFPAYDQPYTCADAPPKLGLPIAPPSGDGWFEANGQLWSPEGEYWYGHGIKLDDWYSFKSEPLIDGYLVWADSTADLIIGLRVKSDRCREGNCAVFVAIDENRSATLDHPLSVFGEEDRIFVVSWNEVFPESPRIKVVPQWQGPDPTRVTEPHLQWPIEAAVGLHESDQGGESYHLEIKIGLPRTSAGASRGAPIGLAIGVVTVPPEEKSRIPPSYYVWPNVPADKNCGQWIARPRFPYTYMTVEPVTQFPEPSTGFLTYNVGLMPYMANGGDGSPHDFATYFAEQDVHVACFQEVWEHGQREQIAALAYELTGKTAQAIGLGSACAEDKIEDGGCSKWDYLLETVSSKALHVQDLGLLMLSKTGMIASDIITFGDDRAGCKGADCLEEKGALWARVGTAQAAVDPCPGDARNCPDRIIVPERSVDVFCTHLQASCDQLAHPRAFWDGVAEVFELAGISIATLLGADYNLSKILCLDPNDYKIVQAKQLAILGEWIEKKRLKDRPAIAMGDFNINSRKFDEISTTHSMYWEMAYWLDAWYLTDFEKATSYLYSVRHDLGLGFHEPCSETNPLLHLGSDPSCEPVLAHEVPDLAQELPDLPFGRFGIATKIKNNGWQTSIHGHLRRRAMTTFG